MKNIFIIIISVFCIIGLYHVSGAQKYIDIDAQPYLDLLYFPDYNCPTQSLPPIINSTGEKEEPIQIFFSVNDSYAPHLATSIASLLLNANPKDILHIHILESTLSDKNKKKIKELKKLNAQATIEFVSINQDNFKTFGLQRLTAETYYRYIIPNISAYRKALYLDSDIIVQTSLKELWNTDISNVYAGAVIDINNDIHRSRFSLDSYFNAGILLLNTEKIRKDNIVPQLFLKTQQLTDTNQLVLEDQDVLNVVLYKNVLLLNETFNDYSQDKAKPTGNIIHFLYGKPWKQKTKYDNLYWLYRCQTPFKFIRNYF